MLEVELARVLHNFGGYFVVALIVVLTWIAATVNTYRRCKTDLLQHADGKAQANIERQRYRIKDLQLEKSELERKLEGERLKNRAITNLLQQAIKIDIEEV